MAATSRHDVCRAVAGRRGSAALRHWSAPCANLVTACQYRYAHIAENCDGGGTLTKPTRQDFENLLAFRVALRRFQRWSEDQAGAVGLTHVQHQLLVAIKGHPGSSPPSVGEIADYLLLQSHSAVGLVDRAETAGYVRRRPDPDDARIARVELTKAGDWLVTGLTEATLAEMHKLAVALNALLPDEQQTG